MPENLSKNRLVFALIHKNSRMYKHPLHQLPVDATPKQTPLPFHQQKIMTGT